MEAYFSLTKITDDKNYVFKICYFSPTLFILNLLLFLKDRKNKSALMPVLQMIDIRSIKSGRCFSRNHYIIRSNIFFYHFFIFMNYLMVIHTSFLFKCLEFYYSKSITITKLSVFLKTCVGGKINLSFGTCTKMDECKSDFFRWNCYYNQQKWKIY